MEEAGICGRQSLIRVGRFEIGVFYGIRVELCIILLLAANLKSEIGENEVIPETYHKG